MSQLGPGSMFQIAKSAKQAEGGNVTKMPKRRAAREAAPYRYDPLPVNFYDWLPGLSAVEIKVYLCVLRKTRGFAKSSDEISLSQFEAFTSASRRQVIYAISRLEELSLLRVIRRHRQLSQYEALSTPKIQPKYRPG